MPKAAKRQGIRNNSFLLTIGQVVFFTIIVIMKEWRDDLKGHNASGHKKMLSPAYYLKKRIFQKALCRIFRKSFQTSR